MDFSTIARRTRSRDPEFYRQLHEKLKNERRASSNGGGQASSSGASGSSTAQNLGGVGTSSRGGGGSSTGPIRGGGGRSTGPSTSHNVIVVDYEEDEEEERRKLKKQRAIISNKVSKEVEKNKGTQREEAERTIRELERARQEAELKKKEINKETTYVRSDRKKEEEEAHKKILEWRRLREQAERIPKKKEINIENTSFRSDRKKEEEEEAHKRILEWRRSREEEERKKEINKEDTYFRSNRKKEEEEAHKKILEWRRMREEASTKENAASTSDLKGKTKMDSGGSSKQEDVVLIDDEETESDSSSESSSEFEFTTSSDDTDDDNSDDEDFDIHEVEEDDEDSDEDADELEVEEESGDGEDSDAAIALPKPKNAKAKVAKVEVNAKRTIIDLEKEVKKTVAAKKRISKKNIITEPVHQTLSDDSDDSIAFPENQNASADVEEQSTFDSSEDIVEVESIPPKKNSNSDIVGEPAHRALSHNDSEDGNALPTKQNSSTDDVEVQAKRTSADLDEKKIESEKTCKRKRVREQAIQAPATKNIVGESAHQALSDDDSNDGIVFAQNKNATADAEVEEQRTVVSLEDVVEVETVAAKESSNSNIIGESAQKAPANDSNDGIPLPENQNTNADVEAELQSTFVSLEDVVEVETVTAKESSTKNVVSEPKHQGVVDDSEDGIALPTKQSVSADVEVIAKTTSVDLEEEEEKIEAEKTSKRKRDSEVAFQAPAKSEKKNPIPYSSTAKVTRVESGSTRSVEQKTEKKTYRTLLLDKKNNVPESGKASAYQTPPVCDEAEFHSLSKNEKKKKVGTRAVRIETEKQSPLKNGKASNSETSPVHDEAAFHSLSDDDARTGDAGIDNDVEDDDLGIDDLSEVDNAVNDEDVDAYDYLLDDDIDVAEKEDGDLGGKHVQSPKIDPLFKLFLNTIWEKGDVIEKEPEIVEVAPSVPEPVNIYKFNYGVEKRLPKEKSDYEIEMDKLWAEYEFALKSCELDTAASSTVTMEEDEEQQIVTDGFTSCGVGKHQLILDEEIGIRCMFCSLVKREIRHILPAFGTPCARERPSRILSPDDPEFCMFDSFPLQATGGDKDSNVQPTGTVWDKFPAIKENLYPHQIEGFEFLWRNLAGGINLDGKNKKPPHGIGGCIISHAPGTGKTLLTIAFLRSYMEIFRDCRPVLIAPSSMLLTWEEEFKKWKVDIAFHNISSVEFSGREDVAARKLVKNKRDAKFNRLVKILSWSRGNGVLGVSYQLFEKLTADRTGGNKEDKESEEIRRILLKKPNLIILDEGHTPRNTSSNIFKCLKNVKTDRRVILSGTPFQNNFDELFNTLWLVRPKFADKISSKRNQTRKKKSKALESGEQSREIWASFTSSIGKNSDVGVAEIRRIIEPFVNVHTGSILQKKLPGLRECVVVLHPTDLQRQLLDEIIKRIKNSFEVERAVALTSVHPSLLIKCSLAKQWNHQKCVVNTLIKKNQCIKEDAFRLNYHEGVKTRFLMQLIKLSDAMNEKVLVFSQFRHPIALIEEYLHSAYGWRMGEEILQMDGSLDVNKRQALITRFNDPESQVKVMLASIKACGEGISLIGASRIVMLDVVWNPSVTKQAISRAYRLGQKKVVYTYHLITSETSEENKYCRQAHKDQLSQQIFFAEQGKTENPDNNSTKVSSDDKILEAMLENNEQKDMFKKIIYQPKESILLETFGAVPSRLA